MRARDAAALLAFCTFVVGAFATLAPAPAAAKCRASALAVAGGDLTDTVTISDAAIVDRFSIWNGPGVRINDRQVHEDPRHQEGNFIDWPAREVAQRPPGLRRYSVAFLCPEARAPQHRRYVVYYEFDPASKGGYLSLPGRGDPHYVDNVFSIAHGVEGKWFRSTATWEALVRPRIEAARLGIAQRGQR